MRSLLNPKTVDKATFKGKCVPKPGGYTAFRSHSNSNLLIHPAWGRWVEEHGLIMDPPTPLQEGRYQLSWLNRRPGATPTVVLTVSGDNWSCVTPHHTDALC